ncbi:hypothetical protein [Methylomarinum vadi]|uniref:hypothetical protein n=1 Tax=Methylomarinum vadi TaxID=438855 RepID=UPI00126922A2|nr:hypothetical protein [Methylomarinum vadi]
MSVLLFTAMAIYTSSLDPGIPSIQLTFTDREFNSILSKWKPSQVEIFKLHFLIDYPFLICYGSLGYLISKRTGIFARFTHTTRRLLAISLPVAVIADAVEDSLHLILLYGAGPFDQAQYFAAGIAALTKWLLIFIFVAFAIYAKFRTAG